MFGSDQSTFFALEADTGNLLWSFQTGGKIIAAPITYTVNGIQQVSIAAGRDLLSFSLPLKPVQSDGNEAQKMHEVAQQ